MDLNSLIGLILLSIVPLMAQATLGGEFAHLFDWVSGVWFLTAFVSVVLIAHPWKELRNSLKRVQEVFVPHALSLQAQVEEIVRVAGIVRKEGVLALESQKSGIRSPLLRKSIKYVIDGFEPERVKDLIQQEIELFKDRDEVAVRVLESASRFAIWSGVTIGLLSGMIALRQASSQVSLPSLLSASLIPVVYGWILGPGVLKALSLKLASRNESNRIERQLILLGVYGVQEGIPPHLLEDKLQLFTRTQ